MKTKKKPVTAKELLSLRNCINPIDFFILEDRSFNINGIEGTFNSIDGDRIIVSFKGYAAHDHWYLNDQTDYLFLLYMLSLMERTKESCYSKEKEAEDRLDKYFRTSKKPSKDTHKARKTRSDKGKKRGSRTRVFWNFTVDDYDKIGEHLGEWIKDYKGREWIISTHPAAPGKFLLKCKEKVDSGKELGWDLEEFGYDDDFLTGWGVSDRDDWDKILNHGMPKEDSEATVESVPSATTEELLLEILTTLKEIKSKL